MKYEYKEGPKATAKFERAMKKIFKARKKKQPGAPPEPDFGLAGDVHRATSAFMQD